MKSSSEKTVSQKNISTGISFGLIIGLIYCLLLFWRWSSASSLIALGLITFVSYLFVLGIMFYEASYRRKLDGGFISLKNLFQTLFISVLIFELIFSAYNFIHLKYIDPGVIEKMKMGMSEMLDKAGSKVSDDDREKALARFDEMKKGTEIKQVVLGYLMYLAISGVFALIIALIMRKKKPVFEEIK